MKTIDEIQEEIISEFEEIGDAFDQYAYLLELSVMHPRFPKEEKLPERAVKGCQSHVWLKIDSKDGVFHFTSDSDTLIIKGVLYLLEQCLCGQKCDDVAKAEITFLSRTELMETFESDRQKGIGYVIRALKEAART